MRARDPHDESLAKRRPETYRGPLLTLGHMQAKGVRRLLIYGSTVFATTAPGDVPRSYRTLVALNKIRSEQVRRSIGALIQERAGGALGLTWLEAPWPSAGPVTLSGIHQRSQGPMPRKYPNNTSSLGD
jgi:hypothetical protein